MRRLTMQPRVKKMMGAALFLTVALLLSVSTASAAILNGQLFLDPAGALSNGCTLPCPFASVKVDLQTPTTAVITFESLTNPAGFTYGLGGVGGGGGPAGNIVGIDLFQLGGTVPTITVSGITPTYLVGSSGDTSGVHYVPFSGNIDGVGSYNLVMTWGDDSSHGSTALLSKLVFTVTNTSGTWGCLRDTDPCPNPLIDNDENVKTSWTNSLTGQDPFTSPSWAMGHLSRCSTAQIAANGTCGVSVVTAWAGGAAVPGTDTPEPGTIALLGTSLLLVGALARRRIKK